MSRERVEEFASIKAAEEILEFGMKEAAEVDDPLLRGAIISSAGFAALFILMFFAPMEALMKVLSEEVKENG